MAIDTFDALKTSIADYLDRTDVSPNIEIAISLAEARFNRELRTLDMEKYEDLTLTDGEVDLPSDYRSWRAVVAQISPLRILSYMSASGLRDAYTIVESGYPNNFSIERGKLVVRPTTSTSVRLVYYSNIEALSVSNTSNWLLATHPNAYLYASLLEMALLLRDSELGATMEALTSRIIAEIMAEDEQARFGAGSGMTVRGICP